MSLISLVYPTKHIIYQNLGEFGGMLCPTLFGGYVERLLRSREVVYPFFTTLVSFLSLPNVLTKVTA